MGLFGRSFADADYTLIGLESTTRPVQALPRSTAFRGGVEFL
jgi:hypothetical protein